MAADSLYLSTSHGRIAAVQNKDDGPALVMLHGNSARKEAFNSQFDGLGERFRLIAIDLPGHGESENAVDPVQTYNLAGYASAVTEALQTIGADKVVVLGHSLGGHIALEMLGRCETLAGLVLVGTPPFRRSPEGLAEAFGQDARASLSFKGELTEDDVVTLAGIVTDNVQPQTYWREAAGRTDPAARVELGRTFIGDRMRDQRSLAGADLPILVINGADDLFINHRYIDGVPFLNLQGGKVHRLKGSQHAPHLSAARSFNDLIEKSFCELLGRGAG